MRRSSRWCLLLLAILAISCAWEQSEDSKRNLAIWKGASHIEVTRDQLPEGTYQVLGQVTAMVMPAPCDKDNIAYNAFEKYGSKVDVVMNFDGGNPVGNGYYDACHGIAVHLIKDQPSS